MVTNALDMSEKQLVPLGIDAGTLSVKMVYSKNGEVLRLRRLHQGEPIRACRQMLEGLALSFNGAAPAVTGKYAALLRDKVSAMEVPTASLMLDTLRNAGLPDIHYVVDIGSSGLAMAELRDGKLCRYETNSLCAAGTGAFLDQQMHRLGLTHEQAAGIEILDNSPSIASRCSVFAKSDLIHRQQAGYSVPQLWNGLVRGLAQAAFTTLFRGSRVEGDVLLIGGLAKNKLFIHYFNQLLENNRVRVPPRADYLLAEALHARVLENRIGRNGHSGDKKQGIMLYEKALQFAGHGMPVHQHYLDQYDNEVDVYDVENGMDLDVFAGVDVGSTSTKMALIDKRGKVRLGLYTRTRGRPVEAFQRLLKGLHTLIGQRSIRVEILGLATTGSGRKLVGAFAGADMQANEITAHLKAAVGLYPEVKTIFEIGGQDAKYISVNDGWMKDANMNYVCAAGTGSFLEEQARNLGVPLDGISKLCRDARPPQANHRCTVFMEQDANQLIARGMDKGQVMASILYAVCKNYLHRVVQHRPVEEPILFLGATAKNSGLVEAFRNVLKKEIRTSPYSHLMGAIGVARMLQAERPAKSRFRGLSLKDMPIELEEEVCTLCHNECRITRLSSGQGEVMASWGYQCGREAGEGITTKRKRQAPAFAFMQQQLEGRKAGRDASRTLYFPKALHHYTYMPFWRTFFDALDIGLETTDAEKEDLHACAGKYALTDCCYPVKLAVGRVVHALQQGHAPLFAPHHIQDEPNPRATNSFFCPLSQAFPSVLKSTLKLQGLDAGVVVSPVVDFSRDEDWNLRQLKQSLGSLWGFSKRKIRDAWRKAQLAQKGYLDTLVSGSPAGKILEEADNKPVFVLMGRSYNILDNMLNLDLPATIARYGYEVVPMDMLPISRHHLPESHRDIYWAYGQKLVVAARHILRHKGLYPIFLSNFNCGPDSFLLSLFEEEIGERPSLILELDEHGEDGGYITRLEAFFDRVEGHFQRHGGSQQAEVRASQPEITGRITASHGSRRLYIPPMHPITSRLMAAAYRRFGVDAVALEKEDAETYALGTALTRGSECMPAASTIGSFLHQVRKDEEEGRGCGNAALFMPCTDGPCRFGQYARLHDRILSGQSVDAAIVSPNSDDNYSDISGGLRKHLFKAMMVSDILDKLGNRLRPYEKERGQTNRVIEYYRDRLQEVFESGGNIKNILRQLRQELHAIDRHQEKKLLVGIVGEIYVRNSPFSNARLVEQIEASGGEAWIAPIMEWMHYVSGFEPSLNPWDYLKAKVKHGYIHHMERSYQKIFDTLLRDRREPSIQRVRAHGQQYLPEQIEGESILTIGRAVAFMEQGAGLVVNVSPFGCMPGSISSAILKQASREYGVAAISLFYDGETDFSQLLDACIRNAD